MCILSFKSLEDCPLDEDEDAFHTLGEEDEDIDQFNDDTFGAGAIGEGFFFFPLCVFSRPFA